MACRFIRSLLAIHSFVLQLSCASPWQAQTITRLPSGLVIEGHMSTWKSAVVEYLGIRYAESPVGKLRFSPPKPYEESGRIVASKYVSLQHERRSNSLIIVRHRRSCCFQKEDSAKVTTIAIVHPMVLAWPPTSLHRKE